MPSWSGLALLAAVSGGVAAAASSPPAGWTQVQDGPAETVYRTMDQGAELRLHAEPGAGGDFEAWFRRRAERPPEGLTFSSARQIASQGHGVLTAMAMARRAGQALIVIGIGCRDGSGQARYAELLTPTADEGRLKSRVGAATEIAVRACISPAQQAAASGPAPAVEPQLPAAPGAGLQDGAIEAVVYSWREVYQIGGLQLVENTYLLLKDGGARKGLPKEPDRFDAAASRRQEPALWGRWRKDADGYRLAFGAGGYEKPPGELVRLPGRRGERLSGRYATSSSYQIPGGGGSWSIRGVSLTPDGRFVTNHRGGVGGSSGYGANQIVGGAAWDDKGVASSVGGPNFGGGSSRTTGVSQADLQGSYTIDGYTITLRYDNGRAERAFFYTDAERKVIWFGGAELARRKD